MSNVRALAAGAIKLSRPSRAPRSGRRINRGLQPASNAATCSGLCTVPSSQAANARVYSNRGANFKQNAWHWRGLRKVGFLGAAKSHATATGFALKFNSMQTHVYRSGTQARVKSVVEGRLRQAPSVAGGEELAAFVNERPNPSIEGTSNIWLRQLSAAPHVKR